jgi:hypothetical protein
MKITGGIIISFCLFTFISCTSVSNKSDDIVTTVKFDHKTFSGQRQLWRDSNVRNYQYQLSAIGAFPYFGTVYVENGNYKSNTPLESYFDITNFLDYSTINKIYETIERMFDLNNKEDQSEKAVYMTEISVEYDKINHIPLAIEYHYHIPTDVAFDTTSIYRIANFQKSE